VVIHWQIASHAKFTVGSHCDVVIFQSCHHPVNKICMLALRCTPLVMDKLTFALLGLTLLSLCAVIRFVRENVLSILFTINVSRVTVNFS